MEANYTYQDAFDELQRIVSEIETGETNVDELSAKIRRASELIAVCKAKLVASEEEVERLLSRLAATEPENTEEEDREEQAEEG